MKYVVSEPNYICCVHESLDLLGVQEMHGELVSFG